MKLSIVFPVLNQNELADAAIESALHKMSGKVDYELIVLDNASDKPVEDFYKDVPHKIIRLEKNIGVYPTFWEALKHTDADILAFLHSDLIIDEQDWDERILAAFNVHPKLGLLGFIGSNEIDPSGGRGLGTTSNFQGVKTIYRDKAGNQKEWTGSTAEVHGKRSHGYSKACVVDGCSMVFRRSVLEQIKQRLDFPPHHFYDRLLSCEVRELGYEVGVLGVGCDHISGQTVNQEEAYQIVFAREWAEKHNLRPSEGANWDSVIYKEAERQWLLEYRDKKHFIPCKV
jgi:glycosyltransferase involved in cell wall biosynthesis